jgi:hypothetical protein
MNNTAQLLVAALQSLAYVDLLLGAPVANQALRLREQTVVLFRQRPAEATH